MKLQSSVIGAYDDLYAATEELWPRRPGRMVAVAAEITRPGRCLDLGCGDGRNLVYLEEAGWIVDGVDISSLAMTALRRRLVRTGVTARGSLCIADAASSSFEREAYNLVLAYGLYHCLDDDRLARVNELVWDALRPGGLVAFASFDDKLAVPEAHGTGPLYLRSARTLRQLFARYHAIQVNSGIITESHEPLIGEHQHSLMWALIQKPPR